MSKINKLKQKRHNYIKAKGRKKERIKSPRTPSISIAESFSQRTKTT